MYTDAELSQRKVDRLLELWAASLVPHNDSPPITNHLDLHQQIDAIRLGSVPWENACLKHNGPLPETTHPLEWMTREYEVWYRNPREIIKTILANPDLEGHIDYAAYREFNGEQRQYGNLMSGDWAWRQSVRLALCAQCSVYSIFLLTYYNLFQQDAIAQDPSMHGSMFIPIILGSDKTTVSVATSQNDFYPLYLSIGNVQNHIRRAHKNALVLIGFLPIPKGYYYLIYSPVTSSQKAITGARKDTDIEPFRMFKRDLTHRSIAMILLPLRPFMTTPDIILCPDCYFHRAIYGLGPHISDYPEQSALTWILYGWCPT